MQGGGGGGLGGWRNGEYPCVQRLGGVDVGKCYMRDRLAGWRWLHLAIENRPHDVSGVDNTGIGISRFHTEASDGVVLGRCLRTFLSSQHKADASAEITLVSKSHQDVASKLNRPVRCHEMHD